MQFLTALAQAVYEARRTGTPLDPQAAEALAQLAQAEPPLEALGTYLDALARGEDAPAPAGLPEPLALFGGRPRRGVADG
jgi:hypothetical protein